jgi:hypothetical protein
MYVVVSWSPGAQRAPLTIAFIRTPPARCAVRDQKLCAIKNMEPLIGIEPMTSSLPRTRSTN